MKKALRIYFWLPESIIQDLKIKIFNFHGVESEGLLQKYLYIIHKISHDRMNKKWEYENTGIRIHTKTLSNAIGFKHVSKILHNLIEWGYIIRVNGYVVGIKSFCYRLSQTLEKRDINRIPMYSQRSNDFIFKLKHSNKNETVNFPIVNYQRKIFENHIRISNNGKAYLRYKYPQLSDIIDLYPNIQWDKECIKINFHPRDYLLLKLFFGEYFVVRPDGDSRIYSNITSLKTEFRQFILMDGKPILNTDLTNSQILFGCFVIEEHLLKVYTSLPKDFVKFKRLCAEGKIYEYIAEKSGKTEMLQKKRGEFKQQFFKYVWFAKPSKNWTSPFFKIFRREFPNVASSILKIKEKDYRLFPVNLQKREAKVMLDIIGEKLKAKRIKFLTIHDSFVVNNLEDLKYAESLILDYFKSKYAVEPTFKNDYNEIINISKLPVYKRFKPTFLFVYNEIEYQLNKKIGGLVSA